MAECRFCDIVAGAVDARRLYEDERTVAFLDDDPATPGHALVVPRRHEGDLLLLEESDLLAVVRTARALAKAMTKVLEPDGFSLFHTTGEFVGSIEHAHLHVVPRSADDGIHISLDRAPIDDATERELLEQLRAALPADQSPTD